MPLSSRTPLSTLIVAVLASLWLGGCAAPLGGEGQATRVTMRQYSGHPISLELRSESHTDAVEFYSTSRAGASIKIVPDSQMRALLADLMDLEFEKYANPGPGPSNGGGGATKMVEVEVDGVLRHVASHPRASREQRSAVVQMATYMTTTFSQVRGFQSVQDSNRGSQLFNGSGPGLDG